jgi:LPXTG-motif cell wall-anchored protein
LLFLLATTLLLVALSLARSGSVVLAASPDPSVAATVGGSAAGTETLLYVLLGIVLLVLGSVAGRRRYRRS